MTKGKKRMTRAERQREEDQAKNARRKNRTLIAYGLATVVAVSGLAFILARLPARAPSYEPPTNLGNEDNETLTEFTIPQSQIVAEAQFFGFDVNGVNVRFFAVRASDGDARVAFDACDVCFSFKKGYRQIGDVMQCNNCGRTFPIASIGTENEQGGCWPSYLPMKENVDRIAIQQKDLAAKSFMFR